VVVLVVVAVEGEGLALDDDLGDVLSGKYRLAIANLPSFGECTVYVECTEDRVEEGQRDLSCCCGGENAVPEEGAGGCQSVYP
jgi:hypothetical protein